MTRSPFSDRLERDLVAGIPTYLERRRRRQAKVAGSTLAAVVVVGLLTVGLLSSGSGGERRVATVGTAPAGKVPSTTTSVGLGSGNTIISTTVVTSPSGTVSSIPPTTRLPVGLPTTTVPAGGPVTTIPVTTTVVPPCPSVPAPEPVTNGLSATLVPSSTTVANTGPTSGSAGASARVHVVNNGTTPVTINGAGFVGGLIVLPGTRTLVAQFAGPLPMIATAPEQFAPGEAADLTTAYIGTTVCGTDTPKLQPGTYDLLVLVPINGTDAQGSYSGTLEARGSITITG